MKKLLTPLILAIIFISGCTKDKTDLILGEWKLTSREENSSYTNYNDDIVSETTTFNGSILSITQSGKVSNYSYSQTLTINADGTYKFESLKNGQMSSNNGEWFWMNSNKDRTSVYLDGTSYQILQLDKNNLVLQSNTSADDNLSDYHNICNIKMTFSR